MSALIAVYGFLTILALVMGLQVFIMGGNDIWDIPDSERRKGAALAMLCFLWPVFLTVWLATKFYEMAVYLARGDES